MTLRELFAKNKNIVINSDIDGMLSGMILQKYYGCKVVGFSNSWDCVWIDPQYENSTVDAINKPVYIDLYVTNPDVVCIEQHIIGYDDAHNKRIAALQTKINPNIMREGRTFSGDYFHKYPFGTVHFLIALMEKEGVHVQLPLLYSITSPKAFKSMFGIKESVSFDSVNFLQSSRHTNTETQSNEVNDFFKSKTTNPKAVAEFMKKVVANPSLLNNVKW